MTHRSILDNSRSAPVARRSSSARDRGAARAGFRPALESLEDRCLLSGNVVTHWNEILMETLGTHTGRILPSRNMALVSVAVFDAVNAIDRSYEPYLADVHASHGASLEAAVAQAARDTLVALYPARQAIFDAALAEDLAGIPAGQAMQGIAIGQEVARQILESRSNDGAGAVVGYTPPSDDPGQWHPTPPDGSPAGGAHLPFVTPFALESNTQFRPEPPPELSSAAYAAAFNEAKALGSATGSTRTDEQTQIGLLWRVPLTNFVVWNRIGQDIASQRDLSIVDSARLFAQLNMAMNDSLQTSFESKFHFGLWRPVDAIRHGGLGGEFDAAVDPRADGNPDTVGDPTWTPLHPGTPPYPTYAGNVATMSAASATVLAGVFGSDDVAFDIDWAAYGFAGVTRSYAGFWAAADEAAWSRVYGGIHFSFDSTAGQGIGVSVGNYVMEHFLAPWDGRSFTAGEAGQGETGESITADAAGGLFASDVAIAIGTTGATGAGGGSTIAAEHVSPAAAAAPADNVAAPPLTGGDPSAVNSNPTETQDSTPGLLDDSLEPSSANPFDGMDEFGV